MSADPILPDKIQLLMEEASCDRAEAELAMSLVGFDLEKAIRTIGTLLRHIVVVKGKFVEATQNLHGLLILIADTRREHFIRARAVVSYNPALYETVLTQHWYEFERCLYASRLGEGALQHVSQDLERSYLDRLEARRGDFFSALKSPDQKEVSVVLNDGFAGSFPQGVQSKFIPEVIDWNQFRRFPLKGDDRPPAEVIPPEGDLSNEGRPHNTNETLRIQLTLVADDEGTLVEEIQEGDQLSVMLADNRDIAHYLAKLIGALNENGPHPFVSPVETLQKEKGWVRFYVRLSAGILGVAEAPEGFRVRSASRDPHRWWQRLWGRRPA
jgi:hypothetical protein